MNNTQKFITKSQIQFTSKLKGFLAFLIMLLFYIQSWGIEPHIPISGSQLYVTAQSGLHLRTGPSGLANSVKVIDLGETVTVLDQTDSLAMTNIDWVQGRWLSVEHEGDKGYIFDGYLSSLAIPTYDWEKCQLDMDMIYPLEQWAETNHFIEKTDTVEGTHLVKVTDNYTGGNKLVKTNSGNIYKIELLLKDIRIMDAYHLLQNMLEEKPSIRTFQSQSIFIEEAYSTELKRIKIKLDSPVDIRKMENGIIKISIHSQEYACQL